MIVPTISWLWPVAAAPFIGSFLGVLVIRLPAGEPVLWDRSVCDECRHPLGLFDLLPFASWLFSRGECRHCGKRISPLYPIIELGALLIALWAATVSEGWDLWTTCGLGWGLFALAVIDRRDGLLPDALTLPLLLAGLGITYLGDPSDLLSHLLGVVAGFGCFAAIRSLYRRFRGREGLGFGDVKLLATAGAWVAWQGLPTVVLIGALFGLADALVERASGKPIALDQRLAFGPGLCLGIWLVWLYGPLG